MTLLLRIKWITTFLIALSLCIISPVFAEQSLETTRQQFAVDMAKAWGIQPLVPETPTFMDLEPSQPHFGYVESLVQLGIVQGRGDKFFGDHPISRQDAAVILYRALSNDNYSISQNSSYQDAHDICFYAKEAVSFVTQKGIMTGNNTMFFPRRALTIAEAEVVVQRILARGNMIGDYFWGVAPKTMELTVGDQQKITIFAQQELLAYTPVFGIDNPSLGTISPEGIFSPVYPGQGLITVNLGKRHHSVMVTVFE